MTTAEKEGFEAYYRGDPMSLNPYDEFDAQWEQWRDGWVSARCEALFQRLPSVLIP